MQSYQELYFSIDIMKKSAESRLSVYQLNRLVILNFHHVQYLCDFYHDSGEISLMDRFEVKIIMNEKIHMYI